MIIIEGADGVGKSITVEHLKKYNIDSQDRNKDVFSKYMMFDVSMKERTKVYEDYLINHEDIVIFIINNNEKELLDRIYKRSIIDKFDLDAPKYNKLYLDTYNYMFKNNMLHDKLFLADCTNKSIDEQVSIVKEIIDNHA